MGLSLNAYSRAGVSNSIYLGATTGNGLVRLGRIMYSTKRLCLKTKTWYDPHVHETWPRCHYYLLTMKCWLCWNSGSTPQFGRHWTHVHMALSEKLQHWYSSLEYCFHGYVQAGSKLWSVGSQTTWQTPHLHKTSLTKLEGHINFQVKTGATKKRSAGRIWPPGRMFETPALAASAPLFDLHSDWPMLHSDREDRSPLRLHKCHG